MTGLEQILKAINDQAQADVDAILTEAGKAAEEILAAARLEAVRECAIIAEKSTSEVQNIISRAESAAALQRKKLLLETKQQLIHEIIYKAKERIAHLPDSEYTDMIMQLIKKFAHNKAGQIIFSAKDKSRLPLNFNDRIRMELSEKPSAGLTVSDQTAAIDGGFLLIYGDVEENCSFEALFDAAKDSLQDKINSLLFE